MTNIVAIVQARVGSTRLPGKVLADLCGEPLLVHALRRAKAAHYLDAVCLAIPDTPENDVLAEIGKAEGVDVHRGSEGDVLSRYFWAAERYPDAQCIVRLTGEDACKDPALIDYTVEAFLSAWGRWDGLTPGQRKHEAAPPPEYVALGPPYWPTGMDVEVFSRSALAQAYLQATLTADREHVTSWIKRQTHLWTVATLKDPQERHCTTSLTVDTEADLERVRGIYAKLYRPDAEPFGYDAIADMEHAHA